MSDQSSIIAFIITMIVLILILSVFIISILLLYQKKQFLFQINIEELKLNHEKNILQTQLEIQEQTFQQISREIHDNISHALTLSKLYLNTLNYPDPVNFQNKIDLSVNLIGEAIHNLSNISRSLNSDLVRNHGLIKAIENEMANLNNTGLFTAEYEIKGTPRYLDFKNELLLFRIIQEAINNIIKHSEAQKINIYFNYLNDGFEIHIEDDGIGFDSKNHFPHSKHNGSGLNNIRQRAEMLKGQFEINSTIGKGTQIKVFIPLIPQTS